MIPNKNTEGVVHDYDSLLARVNKSYDMEDLDFCKCLYEFIYRRLTKLEKFNIRAAARAKAIELKAEGKRGYKKKKSSRYDTKVDR